jgi:hypothetical protein
MQEKHNLIKTNNMQNQMQDKRSIQKREKYMKDQANKISNLKDYKRNFFWVKYIAGCTI